MTQEERKHIDPPGNHTISYLCEAWKFSMKYQVKPSTFACYATIMQKHIRPSIGSVEMEEMNNEILTEFILDRQKQGLSANTLRLILFLLKSVMRTGERRGIYPAEPLDFFLPKDRGGEMKLLSQENRKKLLIWLGNCRTNFELGLLLSISTGIRVGELCGVKWEDVDLEGEVLHIRRTVSRIRNTEQKTTAAKTVLYIGSPKTGTSQRDIPIPGFMLPRLKEKRRDGACYLLTGRLTCMEPRGVQRRFKNLLRKLRMPDVNIHALRHSFASQWIENGFDSKSLSEILGHSSVKITMDIYVHSNMSQKKAYMDQMAALQIPCSHR